MRTGNVHQADSQKVSYGDREGIVVADIEEEVTSEGPIRIVKACTAFGVAAHSRTSVDSGNDSGRAGRIRIELLWIIRDEHIGHAAILNRRQLHPP